MNDLDDLDLDQRIRLTAHVLGKREADRAVRRMLAALQIPDSPTGRLAIERHLQKVLADLITRGENDPISRIQNTIDT